MQQLHKVIILRKIAIMTPSKVYVLRRADREHVAEAYTSKKKLYTRANELCGYMLVGYEHFTRKLASYIEYSIEDFFLPRYKEYAVNYKLSIQMMDVNKPTRFMD